MWIGKSYRYMLLVSIPNVLINVRILRFFFNKHVGWEVPNVFPRSKKHFFTKDQRDGKYIAICDRREVVRSFKYSVEAEICKSCNLTIKNTIRIISNCDFKEDLLKEIGYKDEQLLKKVCSPL